MSRAGLAMGRAFGHAVSVRRRAVAPAPPIPFPIAPRTTTTVPALHPSEAVRWTIVAGLTIAVLMDGVNGTIFTIARAHMMGDAAITPDEASWINTGYLIAKLACLPAAAWLVDRIGEARAFFWSALGVVVASFVCAAPVPFEAFIAARVVQGATGAALLVAAQTIVFRLFPPARQPLVQAVYALAAVMAPVAVAPAAVGWLTDDFSWTWALGLNAMLALVAFVCLRPVWSQVPNTIRRCRSFDWAGFALLSVAMTAIVHVLLQGPRWNWFEADHIAISAIIGGAALIAVIGRIVAGQKRTELFDRSTFANAQFAFGFVVSLVAGFALFGSAFLIPAHAVTVLHLPPMHAGLLLLPSSVAIGAGLLLAAVPMSLRNVNPLKFVPLGIALFMTAMWMLSWSSVDSGGHDLWPALLLRGFGLGFLFLAVTMITLSDLKPDQVASGVGLFNFGRQMGGIIGISFLNTYLNHQIALNRSVLIEAINPASPAFQQRQTALVEALTSRGLDPGVAAQSASAVIQGTLQGQVAALSFNEAFLALVVLFVVAVPLIVAFKLVQKLALRRIKSRQHDETRDARTGN